MLIFYYSNLIFNLSLDVLLYIGMKVISVTVSTEGPIIILHMCCTVLKLAVHFSCDIKAIWDAKGQIEVILHQESCVNF